MTQVYDDCISKGFSCAATYSGLCKDRVKRDLALITSRHDSSLVISKGGEYSLSTAKAFLFHHGLALPQNARGAEIAEEIKGAAAQKLGLDSQDIAFEAYGTDGYFKPSLAVNSLKTVVAGLSDHKGHDVATVLDIHGDVTEYLATKDSVSLGGMAADGTDSQPGLCIITTDAVLTPQALKLALTAATALVNTENFTIIAMANGESGKTIGTCKLTQALSHMLYSLGFSSALQACS